MRLEQGILEYVIIDVAGRPLYHADISLVVICILTKNFLYKTESGIRSAIHFQTSFSSVFNQVFNENWLL